MKTKRIITVQDAMDFFSSSINTLDDAFGIIRMDATCNQIQFDFTAALLLRYEGVYADTIYQYNDEKFDDSFINVLSRCFNEPVNINTEYEYIRKTKDSSYTFSFKLEQTEPHQLTATIICYEKLMETEKHLGMFSNVIGAGTSMFAGSTWWIDYDRYGDHFYQSNIGPEILGIKVAPDKLYNTKEFQKVRENARIVSPFYDESIETENETYERVRNNQTDYFGGRTPALTATDEIVWVEAYGKCFMRYPDGSPRFFVAIDIYLSEIFENINQLETLNNLIDYGLISSNVGVWYHQRHFKEGYYYFTDSYQELMAGNETYKNITFTQLLNKQIAICDSKDSDHSKYLHEFRRVHNSIYTDGLDKYHLIIPNYKDGKTLQWIDVRGTVINRDEDGRVMLFVGINVDITESQNRRLELERLRIQNERLQLAEQLAIKARDLMVWYLEPNQDFSNDYIYGNEAFTTQLGVPRFKDGRVYFDDLFKSLDMSSRDSKKQNVSLVKELRNIIDGKYSSFKQILAKHKNLETGELLYLEHSVEVSNASSESDSRMFGGILLDVTESILNQEKIQYLANHDVLTGIYNRNYFEHFVSNLLPDTYSVLVFDVDGLKLTNDAFGHYEGDKSIQLVANFLSKIFRDNLFLGRIGGDEFIVISSSTNPDEITALANQFEDELTLYNESQPLEVNVSKGGVVVNNNDLTFDKAFVQAENLMYRRKLNSRSSRKSKVLESILETLNAKTEETKDHSDRIGNYSLQTMKGLGLTRASEVEDIQLLSRVHDIGKITVPDEVLFKKDKLTTNEYEIIKKHCEAGYKIIRNITDSDDVCNGVLFHHERWDGNGYPQGLKGEEIPIFARIINVTDSFDAMTNDRIYQKKKSDQEAFAELVRCSGTQFDPAVVRSFLKSCFNIEMDDVVVPKE